ncbi:hypothetical protein STEG23_016764 [Scotinomys teguina]
MARKAGQGEEEEESRARQQGRREDVGDKVVAFSGPPPWAAATPLSKSSLSANLGLLVYLNSLSVPDLILEGWTMEERGGGQSQAAGEDTPARHEEDKMYELLLLYKSMKIGLIAPQL